jgi:DNA-binding CsgD family transcriptional regulator
MSGSSLLQSIDHVVCSLLGALLWAAVLAAFIRKPSRLLFYFLCFYFVSVAHLAVGLVGPSVVQQFGVRRFWEASLAVSRLRYIFLVLFVHEVHGFRAAPALTVVLAGIVGAMIALPFLVYSIIPSLLEILVVLYALCSLLAVYLLRDRISLSYRRRGLLRAVLACSSLFLVGLVLDMLGEIPLASLYVSLVGFHFTPLYIVALGGVIAFWAVRDTLPSAEARPETEGGFDVERLPISRREREVARLILGGETNASIADRLFISESTVKKHVHNMFRKLEITSRWELLKRTRRMEPEE